MNAFTIVRQTLKVRCLMHSAFWLLSLARMHSEQGHAHSMVPHADCSQAPLVCQAQLDQEVSLLQEREFPQSDLRLLERSVFSDRMVFVRAVHESKYMSDLELNVYNSW